MKNKIFITILIATLLLCIAPVAIFAATSTSQVDATGAWEYESYGSGVVLTEYLGSKADVYVPSTVEANGNTYPVLKLSDSIFENNDAINSVTIGEGVIEIGAKAFYDCDALVCILLPESLISIGNEAFAGCDIFNSVILYDGVTSIGNSAFYGCISLTNITIPDGVTSIGYGAFQDCTSLTNITMLDGVTSIGNWAFKNCKSLTNITLPDGVTTIGYGAFKDCTSLHYNIYGDVKHLGNKGNPYFVAITTTDTDLAIYEIHSQAKILAPEVFKGCKSLNSITIPD